MRNREDGVLVEAKPDERRRQRGEPGDRGSDRDSNAGPTRLGGVGSPEDRARVEGDSDPRYAAVLDMAPVHDG